MIKYFILSALTFNVASAHMLELKDQIEKRIYINSQEINKSYPDYIHMFFQGKQQAYFELLDLVDEMDDGGDEA